MIDCPVSIDFGGFISSLCVLFEGIYKTQNVSSGYPRPRISSKKKTPSGVDSFDSPSDAEYHDEKM